MPAPASWPRQCGGGSIDRREGGEEAAPGAQGGATAVLAQVDWVSGTSKFPGPARATAADPDCGEGTMEPSQRVGAKINQMKILWILISCFGWHLDGASFPRNGFLGVTHGRSKFGGVVQSRWILHRGSPRSRRRAAGSHAARAVIGNPQPTCANSADRAGSGRNFKTK